MRFVAYKIAMRIMGDFGDGHRDERNRSHYHQAPFRSEHTENNKTSSVKEQLRGVRVNVGITMVRKHGNQTLIALRPHIKPPIHSLIPHTTTDVWLSYQMLFRILSFPQRQQIALSDTEINILPTTSLGKPKVIFQSIVVTTGDKAGSSLTSRYRGTPSVLLMTSAYPLRILFSKKKSNRRLEGSILYTSINRMKPTIRSSTLN
ncbi:hypothetical protein E1B28_009332 [Marasmius oreades]|uniref:Uncharacterized protein n=1 Tax=Marasmius oreades TaxID=181124 RepID=A0A9P7S0S8_9AGAR|nr:uncharacterized protein E1B28_009332 [Marasmius oreades]KAG7093038.1 hypothetical protein E1B28_009332 [Marasmius oreades]